MIPGYDEWKTEQPHYIESVHEISEKLNGTGYEEIGTGVFVSDEDAFDYALERISQDDDLKQEFVEWFYSGNWIKEE